MFFNSPEELAAHMQEQHARSHLHMQDHIHKRTEFFQKLSKEDLDLVDTLILQCAGDAPFAAYLRGQIGMIAQDKDYVCLCGHDHDAEAAAMVAPESASEKSFAESVDTDPDDGVESDSQADAIPPDEFDDLMAEYDLEVVTNYSDGEPHPTGLRCKTCHQMYSSLADRMIRPPGMDGCGGCQVKSAHGRMADRP